MPKKFFLILIPIFGLISFFVLISPAFSQEVSWPLKEKEIENFLSIIREKPLTDANLDLFFESLRGYDVDAPRKTGAVVLVKQAILKKQLDYWFKEMPKELSKKFLKTVLKIGLTIATKGSYGAYDILNQLEKYTVEKATEYATNWFLQNEIKIGTGEASYSFDSYKGNFQKATFPYIIVYHPLGPTTGKIVAEFYSKIPVEPPIGTSPNGVGRNFDHLESNSWPWDRWLENERQRDNDGKLEPFIVRVKGEVRKNEWGNFKWDETKPEPVVEVDFDSPVPEIDQSDIILKQGETGMKINFLKEKLLKPLIEGLVKARDSLFETGKKVKNKTFDLIEQIKSYLPSLGLGARLVGEEETFEEIIEEVAKEVVEEAKEEATSPGTEKDKIGLKELIEKFDDISEEIEIALAQAGEFLPRTEPEVLVRDLKKDTGSILDDRPDLNQENEEEMGKEEIVNGEKEKKLKEKKLKELKEEISFCSLSGLDGQIPARNKVIFNEIAWMGSLNSANDEWIELKNVSSIPVDLTGWQILDKDEQIKIIFSDRDRVSVNGFFLLERTDDSSVPAILADLIYTGALGNTDETLYLLDKNCRLEDKAEANPSWPAGSNSSKKTMERKINLVWQTSLNPAGTPKAKNSPGEIIYSGGGGVSLISNPPEEEPKITLSYPQENPANKEIEVILTVSFLENTSYDVKISIETARGTISEIFNEKENKWQSSVYYIKAAFAGTSFQGTFKLKIKEDKNDFRGEADILAKIRENGKSKYFSFQDKIKISEPENSPPLAQFGFWPENPQLGQKITFNATSSTDPDGQIVSFGWNFGDGSSTTSALATTSHSFWSPGQFLITLEVADDKGATSTTSTTLQISSPKIADYLIISEVQTQDKEFVELYNPTNESVSTTGWYLSYFSKNKDWSEPQRNWQFSTTSTIPAKSYYLIGIYGYPEENGNPDADWQVLTQGGTAYQTGQLSNNDGAIGLFSCDPSSTTTEKVQNCKIDAVGWKKESATGTIVYEGNPFSFQESKIEEKSFQRKKFEGKFIDNDNNSTDFEIDYPTPTNSKGKTGNIRPPEPVQNFQVANSIDNTVILTWSTTTDPDTPTSSISYILYWSKAGEITTTTLTSTTTASTTTATTTTLTIQDLYYDSIYCFAIQAFDGLHFSTLATTSPYTIPLPKITDFSAGTSANRKAIDLFWTSSAIRWWSIKEQMVKTAKPKKYEIRMAEKEIVESGANENQINWQEATLIENSLTPQEEGEIEHFLVENLAPNKVYYFALKSIGQNGTVSEISNVVKAKAIPGFKDNGDETVTDLYTGLVWLKDGQSTSSFNGAKASQGQAIAFCEQLDFAGQTDWRLPNFKELASLLDYNKNSPTIDENYFQNIKPAQYWTSSHFLTYAPGFPGDLPRFNGWYVDFGSGEVNVVNYEGSDSPNYHLLCLRGPDGQSVLPITGLSGDTTGCELGLQDNGNETVTDLCSNLVWSKTEIKGIGYQDPASGIELGVIWQKAFGVAKTSQLAGQTDWRLPNVQELMRIAGIAEVAQGFTNSHWSLTPDYFEPEKHWFVYLRSTQGVSNSEAKTREYHVRLVREP
ncbi:MAG: DUF1566 domain-containing protein [Patescibacteria group bacterium]|nr:DUF1566 domain-containing protein [Patescibacteria group bacterium]